MRNVLVTGANRGIGLALVNAFAVRGDRVIATARDPASMPSIKGVAVIGLDVTDAGSVEAMAEALGAALQGAPLDILVNNAGIIGPDRQSTLDMDFDGFAETLAVNTLGPLRVSQAVLPYLKRAVGARILTISSAMGSLSHTRSDRIAYRTSKAAVNKVMQALATDLARHDIRVAVAHPGWVRTDMGGSSADLTPAQSAAGLLAVIERMEASNTGLFFNWSGERLPW